MLENVTDSVSNGGLEGYASRVESRKIHANECQTSLEMSPSLPH